MQALADTEAPIPRTDAAIPRERLERDAARTLDILYGGGVAIVPLDVAYAVVGHAEAAIRRIFAAKRRSYDKPSGLFANRSFSEALHVLPDEKRAMIRAILDEERLPFSVVAPFRQNHRLFQDVEPFVQAHSSKDGTLDALLGAGLFHDEIARQSFAAGRPVFGSSANSSLMGSKYRVEDIEDEVRAAADLVIDYGLCRYANPQGRSSTIIDFRDFSVIRVGVCFDRLQAAFRDRFGITLKAPG